LKSAQEQADRSTTGDAIRHGVGNLKGVMHSSLQVLADGDKRTLGVVIPSVLLLSIDLDQKFQQHLDPLLGMSSCPLQWRE
jgi:hypothetical protein